MAMKSNGFFQSHCFHVNEIFTFIMRLHDVFSPMPIAYLPHDRHIRTFFVWQWIEEEDEEPAARDT